MNVNTNLIRQIRQLKRGKDTLSLIEKELKRLGLFKSILTPYAYYLMSFKWWDKDFVMIEAYEELKHIQNWKSTTDEDLFICMSILTKSVIIK